MLVFFRAFLLSYGMHFLQFGWLARCSCICGAGQLATAIGARPLQLNSIVTWTWALALAQCARATNDILLYIRTIPAHEHNVSALRPHHTLSPRCAHTCSGHTTPCHLWPHHTLSPVATPHPVTCGHTTPCHLDVHTRAVSTPHKLDVHARAVATPHPVTWTCSGNTTPCHVDMQWPHHTLSPGRACTCSDHTQSPGCAYIRGVIPGGGGGGGGGRGALATPTFANSNTLTVTISEVHVIWSSKSQYHSINPLHSVHVR